MEKQRIDSSPCAFVFPPAEWPFYSPVHLSNHMRNTGVFLIICFFLTAVGQGFSSSLWELPIILSKLAVLSGCSSQGDQHICIGDSQLLLQGHSSHISFASSWHLRSNDMLALTLQWYLTSSASQGQAVLGWAAQTEEPACLPLLGLWNDEAITSTGG